MEKKRKHKTCYLFFIVCKQQKQNKMMCKNYQKKLIKKTRKKTNQQKALKN